MILIIVVAVVAALMFLGFGRTVRIVPQARAYVVASGLMATAVLQAFLVVVPLGPLGEAGHVVGVVLVAHDPDGLAAFVLRALAENLQEPEPARAGVCRPLLATWA